MKPTSIVFLVVAALLIISGMITCTVAQNRADADGYYLFSDTEDGSTLRRADFSEQPITRMDLVIRDAEIRIIGGASSSYIEVHNFRDGMYTLSTTGRTVALDEILDIKSMFNIGNLSSFSGMRHFLRGQKPQGAKIVEIHLNALAAENLKVISVKGEKCTVYLENLSAMCDITVEGSTLVNMTADRLSNASSLTVKAANAVLDLQDVLLNTFTVNATDAHIDAENFVFQSVDVTIENGEANITAPILLSDYDIEIGSGKGRVNVGGMDRPRPYNTTSDLEKPIGTVRFTSANADFSLRTIAAPTS